MWPEISSTVTSLPDNNWIYDRGLTTPFFCVKIVCVIITGLVYMDFKEYVAMEMKYYEEFYDELEELLHEYTYECDSLEVEYTVQN